MTLLSRIVLLPLLLVVSLGACGKKPAPTPEPVPTATAAPASDAEAPAAEDAAPAEPAIRPPTDKEAKETWDNFLAEGDKFVRSMSNERVEILNQLRTLVFEEETEKYKEPIERLATKLQEFEIGYKPDMLEGSPERMCKLIEEVRVEAEALINSDQSELERVTAELKAIDEKLEAKENVSQKEIDKLEALQKRLSAPTIAGRYMLLAVKSILDEAMVIVDYGVHRARRQLYDCLSKINEKPLELELAQKNLERVLTRAKKLLSMEF